MMCIGLWKVSFQKFEEWFGARWTGTLFMSRGSLSCGFCSAGLSFIISRQLARQVCRQWRRLRRRWRTEVFNGAYVCILGLWQHVGESMDRHIKMVYRMSGQVGRWPIQMSDAIWRFPIPRIRFGVWATYLEHNSTSDQEVEIRFHHLQSELINKDHRHSDVIDVFYSWFDDEAVFDPTIIWWAQRDWGWLEDVKSRISSSFKYNSIQVRTGGTGLYAFISRR